MPKIIAWLRRDLGVLLLSLIATVVMTYPIAFKLQAAVPSTGNDIYTAFWQKYWLVTAVQEGHNPNFTPYLFYPDGLDITFQPRRWAAYGSWIPLTALFGDVAGYNLNVLLGLWVSAYTTYLLIHYLTHDRAAAWIGGAFFAFYPQHINRGLGQPNTGSIQLMPLCVLLLLIAFNRLEKQWSKQEERSFLDSIKILLPSLLVLSWNAYISLKVWMLTVLIVTLLALLLAFARGWWRSPIFWRDMFFLVTAGLILILPITMPYFRSGDLGSAIEMFTPGPGIDLFGIVLPAPGYPPFMTPLLAQKLGLPAARWGGGTAYVGMITVGLVILGLVQDRRERNDKWIWFGLACFFWMLSLGTLVRINAQRYPDLWTPYRLIQWIPVFQAIRQPKRFALVFILPWAVLTGYGAAWLRTRLKPYPIMARLLMIILAAALIYELNEIPLGYRSPVASPFYDYLRDEAPPGAIIELPMGRQPVKGYMMAQTIHHRPLVEGVVARLPEEAYNYIKANPLLLAWLDNEPPSCEYDVAQAAQQLQEDGFIYVILHGENEELTAYFAGTPMTYQGEGFAAYSMEDFIENLPCE